MRLRLATVLVWSRSAAVHGNPRNPINARIWFSGSTINSSYFSGIQGKRALILLSDGQDVASRYSYEEALEFARRTGVAVYAIGLDLPQREFDVRNKLVRLATETGGHHFFIDGARHLDRVYERVQSELRSQYLLAYQSPQQEDGERFREVEVEVGKPGLEAKTVRGYYP